MLSTLVGATKFMRTQMELSGIEDVDDYVPQTIQYEAILEQIEAQQLQAMAQGGMDEGGLERGGVGPTGGPAANSGGPGDQGSGGPITGSDFSGNQGLENTSSFPSQSAPALGGPTGS
jgi:hypothetical protein